LSMNLWAQMQFESERGKPVSEMDGSATDLATLVWACLVQDDPELTVEAVARMVDLDTMETLSGAIEELTGDIPLVVNGETSTQPLASSGE
jgi:hypothetical protein